MARRRDVKDIYAKGVSTIIYSEAKSWNRRWDNQAQALELYLEGLGFRTIGRILKFSNMTILNWIKRFEEQICDISCTGDGDR